MAGIPNFDRDGVLEEINCSLIVLSAVGILQAGVATDMAAAIKMAIAAREHVPPNIALRRMSAEKAKRHMQAASTVTGTPRVL